MLEQPVGVLAISAISGAARRLHIAHTIRLGPKHAQEGFRRHGPRADLDVIGLLQDATVLRPESLQAKDESLEGQRDLRGSQMVFLLRTRLKPLGLCAVPAGLGFYLVPTQR